MKKEKKERIETKIMERLCEHTIGLRTIKTGLAVSLCLLVHLVSPEMGLYGCFAAVVCMRETAVQSWQIGLHRFLGTLIGGVLGYALISLAVHMPFYQKGLYVVMIPASMIIGIWLCTLIDKKNGVVICCVVLIGIGLEPQPDKFATFFNVLIRMIDTTIGIVVAGLVNKYVAPYHEGGDGDDD